MFKKDNKLRNGLKPVNAFPKGHKPWNKGLKGKYKLWPNGRKFPDLTGENHWNWKGDKVGYRGIHHWINKQNGKAIKCNFCGKTGIKHDIQWANIDHKYRRNLADYISLCALCHRTHDDKNNLTHRY